MTDQMLRDLLEERVADVSTRDLSSTAWRTGRRSRRRDRLAAVGAVVVATAAVATVLAVPGDGGQRGPNPAPSAPTETSSTSVADEPDATYEGVPVYWSLAQEQEVNLPYVESSPLPRVIDLGSGRSSTMDRAVVAFDVAGTIRLVDSNGAQMTLDISGLDDVVKANGYGYRPTHDSMLSPSGEYLVFPQDGHVEVYTIATGSWRRVGTGDRVTRFVRWVDDDTVFLPQTEHGAGDAFDVAGDLANPSGPLVGASLLRPGFDTGQAQAFGVTRFSSGGSQAQSWGMGVPVPVADAGRYLSDPEFIAASVGGVPRVLSIQWNIRDEGHGGRFLQCCPVAGWLDDQTLVYESKQTNPAVVAWSVGTDDFALVSVIKGQYLLASFADLDR